MQVFEGYLRNRERNRKEVLYTYICGYRKIVCEREKRRGEVQKQKNSIHDIDQLIT